MEIRRLGAACAALLALAACASSAGEPTARAATTRASDAAVRQPNIILIVADDLAALDLSVYGGSPRSVATPNLDRLARRGVVFRRGYATAPVCSPSRAALMTGQYQQRHGFEFLTPEGPQSGEQGLAAGQRVFAGDLKAAGYRTALFGKWHLGATPDRLPTARGFDRFFGFLPGETAYADQSTPGLTSVPAPYLGARSFTRRADWVRLASDSAGDDKPPVIEHDESTYLTDLLTRKSVDFITSSGNAPYFLYLAHLAPHSPYQALDSDLARFAHVRDPLRRTYAAMIHALDRSVGAILDAVDASGAGEDTIIIFTADNGAATYMGVSDCDAISGGKLSTFEGGARVPLIISWPRRWPKGLVDTRNTSLLDVAPTLLAAAGAPPAGALDGRDLTPLMSPARRREVIHETLFWRVGPEFAVLAGDLKLLSNTRPGAYPWLFDLASDPRETVNLAHVRPGDTGELQRRYQQWSAEMKPPAWPAKQVLQIFQCGRISFHEQ